MKKANIAVIGAGYWGRKHVEEYTNISEVNLVNVSDLSEENLKFCRDNYGVKKTTLNYKEILSSDDVEAVSICTPNETHYALCKEAFAAGKHVLVEKPVTLKSSEAHELVNIAKKKKLAFCVGHIFRFNNALKIIKEKINCGFFGEPGVIKLQWTESREPMKGRDIITDLAPHSFDILNYLIGEWPKKITCKAGMYRRKEPEEWAYIIAEFGKTVGHMELNWSLPGKTREVTICGTVRTAKINCTGQKIKVYESGYEYDIEVDRNNTIKDELEHFVACIHSGERPDNDSVIGAKTVELIEKCFESLKKNGTVAV